LLLCFEVVVGFGAVGGCWVEKGVVVIVVDALVHDYLWFIEYSLLFDWVVKVGFVMAFHVFGGSILGVFQGDLMAWSLSVDLSFDKEF
jgi:hypothetical protein